MKNIFFQISKRSPQFRGFHQQDAHELLRQLAEGLRSEEVKRQKSAILKQFGLCEKTDPKTVDSATKRKLQALGRHSNYTIIDKIFGGQLVSTIVCEQCHNSSQIYEPFLDLSLPLVEEKPQRGKKVVAGVSRQTSHNEKAAESEDIEFKDTKANMKKERAKSKKDKKKARRTKKKGVAGSADLDEVAEEEKKDNNVDENNAVTKQDAEEDNKDDGEEVKMQKELEENEKGEKRESPDSKSDEKEKSPEENEKNGSAESKYETADSNAAVAAADGAGDLTDEGIEEGPVVAAVGDDTGLATLKSADVKGMSDMFEKKSKKESAPGKALADGNEEDDEDGYSEENEEDWEWDYGEQWEEGDGEEGEADANGKEETQPLLAEDQTEDKVEKPKLVSLNPLSPERLARGTSENTEEVQADEERSSSAASSSASETGASSNGDVEDNLDESNTAAGSCLSLLPAEQHEALRNLEPFHPDPEHLDPHMEQLCRKVRKMSVATSAVQDFDGDGDGSSSQKKEYVISNSDAGGAASATASENRVQRLQNDWVARSLTSIAPRYHSTAGECSVYSCLTQFTAPELLTGNNKWACDRCTKMQFEKKKKSDVRISSSEPEGPGSDDVVVAAKDKKKTGEKKPPTVYSNASKQLLIFCPPAVLTIHLKRFQQTFFNLRKINRHVEFPLELDLAHFCSSTSLSTSNVLPGAKSILYSLYAVVEHSGRLQGGHYTAYVKSVKKPETMPDFSKFYSSPASKSEEVHSLLAEIEKKCRENVSQKAAAGEQEEKQEEAPLPSKWYYVSDAHVMEASAEKVLKCQAYLLFYERTL
jgi:ubiquitin C-terminal hydrolase